jgi:hypothetical protein
VQRHQGLHREQQFMLRDEFLDHDRLARLVPQPAGSPDHKAVPAVFVDRNHAAIVQQGLRAIRLAVRETDLEFARQLLVQRIAQKMFHHAIQMLRHIDVFTRAYAGQAASRNIAHRVAARLARGHADRGQAAHRGGCAVERNVMNLYGLARGDMRNTPLRVSSGDIRNRIQLLRRQTPAGHLDAQHVQIRLALAIHAMLQAHRRHAVNIRCRH